MLFDVLTSALTGERVDPAWLRRLVGQPRDDCHTLYNDLARYGALITGPLPADFVTWATANRVTEPEPDSIVLNGHLQAKRQGHGLWQTVHNRPMLTELANMVETQEARLARTLGCSPAAKSLLIFTQRTADAPADGFETTGGVWHTDNSIRTVGTAQRLSFFANIVNEGACRAAGIDPQTFGLRLVDQRNLDYQQYLEIAAEGDECGPSAASLSIIARAGVYQIPVNHGVILSDSTLHRSGLLPAANRPALTPAAVAKIGNICALNAEFSFAR